MRKPMRAPSKALAISSALSRPFDPICGARCTRAVTTSPDQKAAANAIRPKTPSSAPT